MEQVIRSEFGNDYRIADWNVLLKYKNDIIDIVSKLKIDSEFKSVMLTKDRKHFKDKRHNFVSFHNHYKSSSFLARDNINLNYISLGSWCGLNYYILWIS